VEKFVMPVATHRHFPSTPKKNESKTISSLHLRLAVPSVSSQKAEEEEARRHEKKDVKKKEKGKGKKMM
jgi:hypothetical protein